MVKMGGWTTGKERQTKRNDLYSGDEKSIRSSLSQLQPLVCDVANDESGKDRQKTGFIENSRQGREAIRQLVCALVFFDRH